MNMYSIYNSRNELGVIWIWYLACYHIALIKIVFHIFKANAYLVFSVYNNELHTLHYIHAFRSHLSVFESNERGYKPVWNLLQQFPILDIVFIFFNFRSISKRTGMLFWNLSNLNMNWYQLMLDVVKGFENVEICKNWIGPWLPWAFKWKGTEEHFWVSLRLYLFIFTCYVKVW